MTDYERVMASNPPTVGIAYKRGESRKEDAYSWSIRGEIPVAHLVGYITRVQAELAFRSPPPCDDCALVIAFDPKTSEMSWFVDPLIPVDPLVGTLEILKQMLIVSQLEQVAKAAQKSKDTGLYNAAGQPIIKR